MAEEFGDGAFWLPSEFLCDDFLVEEARKRRAEAAIVLRQRLGSKVEPHDAAAAADTASIEEYMATIARQMAQASIVVTENAKTRQTAGTPHSVLCPYLASTRRNPNDPSLVSSMPSLPLERQQNDAWDLLCEAAAQVTWLRHNDAVFLRKNASLEIPRIPNYTRVGYYSSPALPQHQQLQSAQVRPSCSSVAYLFLLIGMFVIVTGKYYVFAFPICSSDTLNSSSGLRRRKGMAKQEEAAPMACSRPLGRLLQLCINLFDPVTAWGLFCQTARPLKGYRLVQASSCHGFL
ncbi:hypothetical protein BHE74_00056703 [Ensete ventricosum]|nr:hypothetical protein BHE74_00056703 [Ensete ventricosum]